MGKSIQILSSGGSLFIDEFDRKNKNKDNKVTNNNQNNPNNKNQQIN